MLLLLLLTVAGVHAQKVTDIQFSYFIQTSSEGDLGKDFIEIDGSKGKLYESSWVGENPTTRAHIVQLLTALKANGTEDVSKCFIPRHVVTLYSNDKILYRVLLCFECDGIRFSNQKMSTAIKSVTKREKKMKELKSVFTKFLFLTEGF